MGGTVVGTYGDGAPDPDRATDLAGFIALLGELRAWAGQPSYRTLAKRVGPLMRPPQVVSASTVIDAFKSGRRRLDMDLVVAIVRALGVDEPGVVGWRRACVAVHAAAKSTGPIGVFRQLPADPAGFVGRDEELARLEATITAPGAAASTVVISAIDGMGGVGKSALAVRAAHRLRGRYPDGQLFIDLHGHTAGQAPRDAAEVLEWFLRSLGVPPQSIPRELDERAACYRDRLADTRTLIVLDNAVGTAQIRPLLPGTPGCLVIVTSRKRLTGLDDAHTVALDTLTPAEATELLHRVAGPDRIPRGHPAIAELVELCGRLPLAIRIVAARLRHRRALRVEDLVEQLRDESGRLGRLGDEARDLTAVFDASYTALPEAERRLFRRLGRVPGPDFDGYAAANLLDADVPTAERLLDSLLDHNLLIQLTPGRYRFHDLIGLHARSRGADGPRGDCEPTEEAERAAARGRLLDYYLHTARQADGRLTPHQRPGPPRTGPVPVAVPDLPDRAAALTWVRAERDNLMAVAADPRCVIALAASLAAFLLQEGPWPQAAALQRSAADAAHESGDRYGEATALENLGRVWYVQGEFAAAAEPYERALAGYRDVGDRHGEASALEELGRVRYMLGEFAAAAELHERALAGFRELGDRYGEAGSLWSLGRVRHATGDYPAAADALEQALARYLDVGARQGEASALWELSRVRHASGDYPGAGSLQERALVIMRELGNRQGEANALWSLGRIRLTTGDVPAAAAALERALAIYLDLGKRDGEAYALKDLGRVRAATGDVSAAIELLERALILFRDLGQRYGEINTLHDLGRVRHAAGDVPAAAALFERARAFFRDAGDHQGEAEVLTSMGALTLDTAGPRAALPLYREARDLARRVHSPLDEARALEGAARCTVHTPEHEAALAHLRQAVALYDTLGAAEAKTTAAYLATFE
ncbi:ATP-binding protein [Embleya sp. AB8]|uniref:ATP-binding protein n=1 Tax=Embleya sp. AB8 TaxID=3156304 RepID=UPI003C77AEB8